MAALTTEQLDCLLDCVVLDSTRVLGVFPANCVPMRCAPGNMQELVLRSNIASSTERHPQLSTRQHTCFILNTDPASAPGEHWLAFFYNANTRHLEYFDSFGLPLAMYPAVRAGIASCNLLPICVQANSSGMLQSLGSKVCGHYCVVFLYWRAKHINSQLQRFSHCVMSAHSSALDRDRLIVDRLRSITKNHPCCSTQLFGTAAPLISCAMVRSSQSCCCRSDMHI